jgi:hypothetical protein
MNRCEASIWDRTQCTRNGAILKDNHWLCKTHASKNPNDYSNNFYYTKILCPNCNLPIEDNRPITAHPIYSDSTGKFESPKMAYLYWCKKCKRRFSSYEHR